MASLETIKRGENFIIYKNGDQKLIKIENVRFSYPHFGRHSFSAAIRKGERPDLLWLVPGNRKCFTSVGDGFVADDD